MGTCMSRSFSASRPVRAQYKPCLAHLNFTSKVVFWKTTS
jgi:hypothetical protein